MSLVHRTTARPGLAAFGVAFAFVLAVPVLGAVRAQERAPLRESLPPDALDFLESDRWQKELPDRMRRDRDSAGGSESDPDRQARDSVVKPGRFRKNRPLDPHTQWPSFACGDVAAGGSILVVLVLLAIGLLVAFILVRALGDRMPNVRQAREGGTPSIAPEPAPRVELADADRLAREGRHAAALHALLLAAIGRVEARMERALDRSRTAREIARDPSLDAGLRTSLDALVRRVEPVWFGGVPAGAEEFAACRQRFTALFPGDSPDARRGGRIS